MNKTGSLLKKLRSAFEAAADSKRAPQMQAYMKSQMPFHGVPAPQMRRICREVFLDYAPKSSDEWQRDVLEIFRGARFREERYAAVALCAHKKARAFQTPDALAMYEELIVTGAWWDLVDELATHRVGDLLRAYPNELK